MKIELKLSDKSKKLIRKMPDVTVPAIYKGMKRAMLTAERTAKGEYLSGRALKRRTGRLRSSLTAHVAIVGDHVVGRLGTNVIYARIHEKGGEIRPKRAKALRFQIPGVGWRTVKKVTMPKRPFLRPAFEDNTDEFRAIFSKAMREAFE